METNEIIEKLKSYSKIKTNDTKKSVYKNIEYKHTDYIIGIIIMNLVKEDKYEVYMYIRDNDKNIASGLFGKSFKDIFDANNYFEDLRFLAESKSLESLYTKAKQKK